MIEIIKRKQQGEVMNPNEPINPADEQIDNQPEPTEPLPQPIQEITPLPTNDVPEMPIATESTSIEPPTVEPVPPTPSAELPPTPPKKSNKGLIIALSVIGGLILIAGIVLAIVLVATKNEDVSSTDKTTSSEEKPIIDDSEEDSTDDSDITTNTNANGERELSCKVANISGQSLDMTMSIIVDKQEKVDRVVYEYQITNGQTITQEQLASLKSGLQEQFATLNVTTTVTSQMTSTGSALMTVTSNDWSKAGYAGGYDSIKKTFENECTTYAGTFNSLESQ